MGDNLVSLDQLKELLRSDEMLTPERTYGRTYMAKWRRDQDELDRIVAEVNATAAAKDRAGTTQDPAGTAKDTGLPDHLDPARNPMIKIAPDR